MESLLGRLDELLTLAEAHSDRVLGSLARDVAQACEAAPDVSGVEELGRVLRRHPLSGAPGVYVGAIADFVDGIAIVRREREALDRARHAAMKASWRDVLRTLAQGRPLPQSSLGFKQKSQASTELKRMREAGLVEVWQDDTVGDNRLRLHWLTQRGRKIVQETLRADWDDLAARHDLAVAVIQFWPRIVRDRRDFYLYASSLLVVAGLLSKGATWSAAERMFASILRIGPLGWTPHEEDVPWFETCREAWPTDTDDGALLLHLAEVMVTFEAGPPNRRIVEALRASGDALSGRAPDDPRLAFWAAYAVYTAIAQGTAEADRTELLARTRVLLNGASSPIARHWLAATMSIQGHTEDAMAVWRQIAVADWEEPALDSGRFGGVHAKLLAALVEVQVAAGLNAALPPYREILATVVDRWITSDPRCRDEGCPEAIFSLSPHELGPALAWAFAHEDAVRAAIDARKSRQTREAKQVNTVTTRFAAELALLTQRVEQLDPGVVSKALVQQLRDLNQELKLFAADHRAIDFPSTLPDPLDSSASTDPWAASWAAREGQGTAAR